MQTSTRQAWVGPESLHSSKRPSAAAAAGPGAVWGGASEPLLSPVPLRTSSSPQAPTLIKPESLGGRPRHTLPPPKAANQDKWCVGTKEDSESGHPFLKNLPRQLQHVAESKNSTAGSFYLEGWLPFLEAKSPSGWECCHEPPSLQLPGPRGCATSCG